MVRLGSLILDGTPRVVVGFEDNVPIGLLDEARSAGVDIAELRIDRYSDHHPEYVKQEVSRFRNFATIATIRIKSEGGAWPLDETSRLALFEAVIPHVHGVDVELSAREISASVVNAAHRAGKLVFVSYHNFETTPSTTELDTILASAKAAGGDVVKIATAASSLSDIQTLSEFTIRNASQNIVTVAMGSEGTLSRVFFPALGSLVTFAHRGNPTAPGQLSYQEMFELLKKFYPHKRTPTPNAI